MSKPFHRCLVRSSRAFTLTELLVVIAIVSILISIVIPTIGAVRSRMTRTADVATVRQIGAGISLYIVEHDGTLPGPMWTSQTAQYYYHTPEWRSWNLLEFIAPYLSLPEADGTRRVGDAFVSPGYLANPQNVSEDDIPYMTNYIMNNRTPGLDQLPFGVPLRDGVIVNPIRMASVPDQGSTWAMISADQEISSVASYTNNTSMAPEPYNGDYRTVLYFDWHVNSVTTDTELDNVYP